MPEGSTSELERSPLSAQYRTAAMPTCPSRVVAPLLEVTAHLDRRRGRPVLPLGDRRVDERVREAVPSRGDDGGKQRNEGQRTPGRSEKESLSRPVTAYFFEGQESEEAGAEGERPDRPHAIPRRRLDEETGRERREDADGREQQLVPSKHAALPRGEQPDNSGSE